MIVACGGRVEVRVVEHDDRAVAAHLEHAAPSRPQPPRPSCPVSVEPMKATACVPGFGRSRRRRSRPGPVTRLKTPGGRSASTTHSASATGRRPWSTAGVQTTALPLASAGAISSAGIVYGQFQGVIDADDAARSADEQDPLARRERVRQPALQPLRVLGRHPPVLDELLDLVVGLGAQRLALVERQRRVRARRGAPRSRRRPRASSPRARTRSAAPTRRRRGSPPRSHGGRPRGPPAAPRRSLLPSPGSRR